MDCELKLKVNISTFLGAEVILILINGRVIAR